MTLKVICRFTLFFQLATPSFDPEYMTSGNCNSEFEQLLSETFLANPVDLEGIRLGKLK